jgi:dsRNA-specific ribonuclease
MCERCNKAVEALTTEEIVSALKTLQNEVHCLCDALEITASAVEQAARIAALALLDPEFREEWAKVTKNDTKSPEALDDTMRLVLAAVAESSGWADDDSPVEEILTRTAMERTITDDLSMN